MDINGQIAYWRNSSSEDWQVAQELIENGRVRHGLFFIHLAMEKILKAHVTKAIQDIPPRIHNLLRLSELANINPSSETIDTLQMVNQYNIEGRYPEGLDSPPTLSEAKAEVNQVKEVFEWLIQIL